MSTVKVSHELKELAEIKARSLNPGQQIRLTPELNWWIFKMKDGLIFIGTMVSEEPILVKFFKNRPVYQMLDKEGKHIGNLQRLIVK